MYTRTKCLKYFILLFACTNTSLIQVLLFVHFYYIIDLFILINYNLFKRLSQHTASWYNTYKNTIKIDAKIYIHIMMTNMYMILE